MDDALGASLGDSLRKRFGVRHVCLERDCSRTEPGEQMNPDETLGPSHRDRA
jgi:hypothetical protein